MNWSYLAQDWKRWHSLVNVVMNLRVQWNAGNCSNTRGPVSFSGRTLLCRVN